MTEPPKSPTPVFNPYAHLARQVRALLRVEMLFSPDERQNIEWVLQVGVHGEKVVVGKGGANTIFFTFGSGKRQICFPDRILAILDKLARQPFVLYTVYVGKGSAVKFDRDHALKVQPLVGSTIMGKTVHGKTATVFRGRKDLSGNVRWMKI